MEKNGGESGCVRGGVRVERRDFGVKRRDFGVKRSSIRFKEGNWISYEEDT